MMSITIIKYQTFSPISYSLIASQGSSDLISYRSSYFEAIPNILAALSPQYHAYNKLVDGIAIIICS